MHGQQNDKYIQMHAQQNGKYTEMHAHQNVKTCMFKSSWGWIYGLSKHFAEAIIELNH